MIKKEARLELIIGTMFSGKSTELIQCAKRYRIAGIDVQIFKPSIDTRYSQEHVTSHDKLQMEAVYVNSVEEMKRKTLPRTKVIGIDEVQFFESSIIDACTDYVNQGKIVLAAGLHKDFRDEYFAFRDGVKNMSELIRVADELVFPKAICTAQNGGGDICGQESARVQRYIDNQVAPYDSPVVQVGGKESYAPRCRQHYQFYKQKNI